MASTGASSNDAIASYDNPKFSEYRSQVCFIYPL